jgi:dTDP-4-dehydrorhamnose 3,5-epimerase
MDMQMRLIPLGIEGAWLAESPIWSDERGYFREWFKIGDIEAATGINFSIQQANISQSDRGVIRGIHYSLAPEGQSKWITCVQGSILDVVVDIRPDSATFGKYKSVVLSGSEGRAVLIGPGLGHAFLSLENKTTIAYLLSSEYSPTQEFEIRPTDSELAIDWESHFDGGSTPTLSSKDATAPTMRERLSQGHLPKY